MKKVIFGGFCLIAGVLLFCLSLMTLNNTGNTIYGHIAMLGAALGVFGLILGIVGLRKDD